MRRVLVLAAFAAGCAGGRPAVRSEAAASLPPWVAARGEAGFRERLQDAWGRLERTRSGRLLLDKLAGTGATVVVRRRRLPSAIAAGGGSRPVVWWNPEFQAPETPAFVALHHELVHAFQRSRGPIATGEWMELEAVGLSEFSDVPYSENALREELGLPRRESHRDLPGFTQDKLRDLLHQAYTREGAARDEIHLPRASGWKPPRVDARIPEWAEEDR